MRRQKAKGKTWNLLWLFAIALLLSPAPASAQSETVVYYHTDAIGSVRATSDENGDVIERFDYLPFGELCDACGASPAPDKRQYAGKESDAETGLDYFGARYLRSQSGRFTSIDPAMQIELSLPNPQRWNRYAYAGNNPFRFVDPDGANFWDFSNGLADAVRANFVLGIGRSTDGNSDFRAGQFAGDLVSLGISTYQHVVASGAIVGGMAACGTGVGCLAGAPAIAVGASLELQAAAIGVSAGVSLMSSVGSGGTRTDSKTLFNKDGIRVDVENPAPDRRPGQVHLQTGKEKYIYDPANGSVQECAAADSEAARTR